MAHMATQTLRKQVALLFESESRGDGSFPN